MSAADGTIRRLAGDADLPECARMMAESEPWITLGRTVEASIRTLRDPGKKCTSVRTRDGSSGSW